MPFQSTSVWVEAAPRVNIDVALPALPLRATITPGTSRRRSATSRACWRSISSRVMTVTAAGVASTVSGRAEAVTTISSLTAGGAEVWAKAVVARRRLAKTRGDRKGFTTLPSEVVQGRLDRVGLLASGSSFSRALPALPQWGSTRPCVSRLRLQWRGPRRYHTGFPRANAPPSALPLELGLKRAGGRL